MVLTASLPVIVSRLYYAGEKARLVELLRSVFKIVLAVQLVVALGLFFLAPDVARLFEVQSTDRQF